MPREVSDERERYWRDLVMHQPMSGLNIARFGKDAGVLQNAFYIWKKRLWATTQQGRAATPRRKHRQKKAVKPLVPMRRKCIPFSVEELINWSVVARLIKQRTQRRSSWFHLRS
jgi:hypothetical protein